MQFTMRDAGGRDSTVYEIGISSFREKFPMQ